MPRMICRNTLYVEIGIKRYLYNYLPQCLLETDTKKAVFVDDFL
jgi:hypothetical protein